MSVVVKLPTGYFPDPDEGRPVALGTVFIGVIDTDPEILANRITVTLLQEDGTEVSIPPASQPLSLNAGGVFTHNGSVVQVLVDRNYAMTVLDANSVQQFYFPNSNSFTGYDFTFLFTTGASNSLSVTSTGLAAGGLVQTFHYDSNKTINSGAIFQATGTTTVGKAGNCPDADGLFYDADGLQFTPPLNDRLHIRIWGATGDGVTDDSTAIQAAITLAQSTGGHPSVQLGSGVFAVGTQLTITGANQGIAIIGSLHASAQQGSTEPTSTVKWTGGASAVFAVSSTFTSFLDLAIQNTGTATSAIEYTSMSRLLVEGLSCVEGTGDTAFSEAFIKIVNPVAYARFSRNEFFTNTGPANMILMDGQSAASGSTTIHIFDNIFDTQADVNVFKAIDGSIDLLSVHNNTFNTQGADVLVGVDLDSIGGAFQVGTFSYYDNEYDLGLAAANARVAKLTNVQNANFYGNHINGTGMAGCVDVTTSNVQARSNFLNSVSGKFFNVLDSTSNVFIGPNFVNTGNVQGMVDDAATSGIIEPTFAASVLLFGNLGNPEATTIYLVTATSAINLTLIGAQDTDGTPGFMTRGQVFKVIIRNASGGVMGNTLFSAQFNTSGAFTKPADGFSRSITFVAEGPSNFTEIDRSVADVAN